jgi:hypothetical protein
VSEKNYIKLLEEQNEELKSRLAAREHDQNIMLKQLLNNWKKYYGEYHEVIGSIGWNKNGKFTYDNLSPNHVEKVRKLIIALHALNENMEGMLYRYGE